jgi:hypothetical protein
MNEERFGFAIRQALDAGLDMSPNVTARLRAAREGALDRLGAPVAGKTTAGAGHSPTPRLDDSRESWIRAAVPVAVLIAALFGVHQWQEAHQVDLAAAQVTAEFVEVDSGVLTGDLPINAYLDEDFQAWLKQASE